MVDMTNICGKKNDAGRKQVETQQLGHLLQNSFNEIYLFDAGTLCFLQASEGVKKNLGYSIDELKQLTPLDIKPSFTRESFERMITPLREDERQLLNFETILRRKDGTTYPVEINLQFMPLATPVFMAIVQDITERKRTDDMLRVAATAFEVREAITIADVHGNIIRVNKAFENITGYSQKEVLGKNPRILQSGRQDKAFYAEMWRRLLNNGSWFGEIWNKRKNGQIYPEWLTITAVKNEQGETTGYVAVFSDISEQKYIDKTLRIAAIAFETHEAILITDANANIIRVNQAFQDITGYTSEEVLEKNPRILSSGRHDKAFYAAMWQQLLGTGSWTGEIWDRRKGGQIYPKWTTITAVKNEQGEITEYVAIFSDITARKEMEDKLRKHNEELEAINHQLQDTQNQLLQSEKMASIGHLAAGVAHEINNPIGYVYSNLGTLDKYVQDAFRMIERYGQAEGAIPDEAVRAQIKAAREELDIEFLKEDLRALMDESKDGITRVKKIVQSLKDFSHVDILDEWHFADLHKGLDSTLNIVHNELKYKADVVREYGELPEVECLSSQLNQVFMNLLVNAAHAIEGHGTITIRTGQQNGEVWVEVADTGKGIAPEHLKKIFDPFFTTKPVGKGTGLGLSLSYGIVQKHHGHIEVQSEVDKGTTFRVWLPVSQPKDENTLRNA